MDRRIAMRLIVAMSLSLLAPRPTLAQPYELPPPLPDAPFTPESDTSVRPHLPSDSEPVLDHLVQPHSPWDTLSVVDPAARFLGENQPQLVERLHEQVLDLEPNADNRRAIERVRETTQETLVGVDTLNERWVEADNGISLRWGGRINLDWINWADGEQFTGQPNYVDFRRLRLMAAGEGYGVYFYQLELDFVPEFRLQSSAQNDLIEPRFGIEVKDAFIGIRELPWLGTVKLGHFFTPIGLEQQTTSNTIPFLERSLAYRLLPGRELGIAAYHHLFNERFIWSYGAFFDEFDEAAHRIVNDNQGTRLIGRVAATPYYDDLSEGRYLVHLGLGYAYTRPRLYSDADHPNGWRPVAFAARPEIRRSEFLVNTGDIDTDDYQLTNGEFAWVCGPLSVQSELAWVNLQEAAGANVDFWGSYVYASYFLTGEHRVYDRRQGSFDTVVPLENFWMVRTPRGSNAGWGAWELGCRLSYLDFRDVDGQQLHDLTLGLNWYWNPDARLMFNWIHPVAQNSPVATVPDAEGDILAMRLQVTF